ncbi:multidrug effflux MFS transporter [Ornithinibacillus gellani]|uniref:multidrug effflux MFS transporter n=1 Tax=Ornithinibacillus gellani TaxID=2293253 RepID=UPI000F4A45FF|nr:multidrug effflux MFS transporter [Ornithinibacillus gellani]TQS76440.1 multidrug effflux MFS transporter [Ornithinibacillus gellani]
MSQPEQQSFDQVNPESFRRLWLVLILGSLTAFGPLSMDMYLPALPVVTIELHTSASLAQLSITACLLGLAVGQLLFGPLSDIQGRRRPLLTTLVVYAVASVLCAFSPTIWLFIAMRFIQGFAGAAGIVIARASAKDMYEGKELTKFIALLALVNGAAPILAPIFGGIILKWIAWPAIFIILGIIGVAMFLAVQFTLPETLPVEKRQQGDLLATVKTFADLLKDRVFMGIALSQALISMGMFAYISGSPFVLQNVYGVSAQTFSIIFAINGVGIIIAAQLTGRLAFRMQEKQLLLTGILIAVTGGTLFLTVVMLELPLWLLLIALFLVVSSVGMVSTTSFSMGMERQGKHAGSASAFLGILPFGGGALVSPLVGLGGDYTAIPMAITIFCCVILGLLVFLGMVKDTNPAADMSNVIN